MIFIGNKNFLYNRFYLFNFIQRLFQLQKNKMQDDHVSSLVTTESLSHEESDRFIKYHPFINVLIMSVGPFLSTLGLAVLDSVDLMIVSRRFKNVPNSYAVQIIGIGYFVLQVCHDIGIFFAQAVIVRVSTLIGKGKREKASQLTVDVFRLSILINVISTIIITFIARPIMEFAGCTPNIIERCMLLIISTIAGLPFYSLFHIGTGFLQGIGKAVMNGLIHLGANILQTFVITPLLLFAFKVDVTLINISQPIAQSIFGIILFICIFNGRFSLQPTMQMWFFPFCKETRKGALMSLPLIPTFINALVPSSLILRYMTSACEDQKMKTDIIAVYTVILKIFMIGLALPVALSVGFLTTGTHSMAVMNYRRMLVALSFVFIVTIVFLTLFIPLMIGKPLLVMKLFMSSKSQLDLAKKMVPIPMFTFGLAVCFHTLGTFFITAKKPLIAFVIPFVQLSSLCISSKVISLKFPNEPIKVLHAYNVCDIITFTVTMVLFIVTIIPLIKKAKQNNDNAAPSKQALTQTPDLDKIYGNQY